jgi:hypothetical protein
MEQGATFSGKRLGVKNQKTAVPIFYPPSFTSQVILAVVLILTADKTLI